MSSVVDDPVIMQDNFRGVPETQSVAVGCGEWFFSPLLAAFFGLLLTELSSGSLRTFEPSITESSWSSRTRCGGDAGSLTPRCSAAVACELIVGFCGHTH